MLGGEKPDLPKQSQMLIPDPEDAKDAGNADSRNEARLQTSHGILKSRNKARLSTDIQKGDLPKQSQMAAGR